MKTSLKNVTKSKSQYIKNALVSPQNSIRELVGVLGTWDEAEKGAGKSQLWRVAEENCDCLP